MGKWKYGVILDAGSSGTRIHVYRWLNPAKARQSAGKKELESLPVLKTEKEWTKKTHPGVSTFGEKPERVGPDHLESLFKHALKHIPADEIEHTPIFLLATAGMRLLPDMQRKTLLQEICTYAQHNTKFQLPDCDLHIQVIPGETEGLYGWIAANYLLSGFDSPEEHDHGKGHHTYGFLDMGGASAQIAFAPNATETEKHANDLKLLRMRTLNGKQSEYKVFVTTWLGFGMNEARKRYVKSLLEASPADAKEMPDPCLPSGLEVALDGTPIEDSKGAKPGEPHLIGTGKFPECLSRTFPLLDKDKPCPDKPCLFQGVHVPAIDFDVNHFVGVSEYWHTTHEVFEMAHKDKAYDFHAYQTLVNEFCSQDWDTIEDGVEHKKWGKKVDAETAQEVCFKASWLINVLHDGIGVPRVGLDAHGNHTKGAVDAANPKGFLDPFQAVNKIDGIEVSWTLGKMVLYASSQVPPAEDVLEVGFGSNEPGVVLPSDFQPAGGKYADSLADLDDWHDVLFSDSPRRIPGFLFFALIIIFACFLLCGKARRSSAYHKISYILGRRGPHSSPKHRRRAGPLRNLGGKLFGHSQPSYERVLESGETAAEFELSEPSDSDNEHSDSSEGSNANSRVGRTSGWATPQLKVGIEHNSVSPAGASYFDNVVSQGVGLGLGPPGALSGMGRQGLISRTESRERLAPSREREGHGGGRTGSPSRMKSPLLTSFKKSVD